MSRHLLAALVPLALLAALSYHSGPGSPLHKQLDAWPIGQRYLEQAHAATVQLHEQGAALVQQARPLAEQAVARLTGAAAPGAAPATEPSAAPPKEEAATFEVLAQQVLDASRTVDAATCHLQGTVDDCCNCTYSSVHHINERHVHPLVTELVKTAFFRYFKVNIYCDCPLWPDDSMCSLRACSVCECDDGEVPKAWLAAERGLPVSKGEHGCHGAAQPDCNAADCAIEMESQVDQTLEPGMKSRLKHLKGWRGINNPWMAEGGKEEDYLYINLLTNPERYTGYKGEHAHRIWKAIYDTIDCAKREAGEQCTETRVFQRLVSGMHSSISTHLTAYWLLDEDKGIWGPNLEEFKRRLGTPEATERVQNLYFAYLFVLRAVLKAGPILADLSYITGSPQEDARTKELVSALLSNPAMLQSCPLPFDEGRLWKGERGAELKAQLQVAFQNITRVMDCVGCEKCKLWGKLQTLGVATALKVLFAANDCSGEAPGKDAPFSDLSLERNEAIALINLLARFSNSIHLYHELAARLEREGSGQVPAAVAGGAPVA